ncbi:MAG: hypothetical protein NTY08_10385 [Proteobacteria bacterium]|nr:hypothetical protein [Pseudomonadota bacterium]
MTASVRTLRVCWLRGGYPLSCLALGDRPSADWREQYISSFLERDLAMLGLNAPSTVMRRLWTMLTLYHGQKANLPELANSLDLSQATVKRYV